MKSKRFMGIIVLVVCAVMVLPAYARTHTFYYDSSVSAARNKVAEYAYEILNYEWTTNKTILRYNGSSQTSGTTTGTIHGVPYANNMTFQAYKALSLADKERQSGKQMYYGMVCASLVTDCIRQGFLPTRMPFDGLCLFHKRTNSYYSYRYDDGWNGHISSIESDRLWRNFANYTEWSNAWQNDFQAKVKANDYEAYKRLKRGDYFDNYNHVILVINNDTSSQTMTCIDQTTCAYISETDRVGTRIRYDVKYSVLASDSYSYRYVPMYVQYPDDGTPPQITSTPVVRRIAGQYYSFKCQANNNPSSWSIATAYTNNSTYNIDGSLPPGLSINSSTGEISGTPEHTDRGKASYYPLSYSFNVIAENSAGRSSKYANISVSEPPVITTGILLSAEPNQYYSKEFYAEGTEAGMEWSVNGGVLPKELKFKFNKDSRIAKLEGTPVRAGTYQFTLKVRNSSNISVSKTFTLTVSGIYPEPNMWINGSFKDGKVGESYSSTIQLYFRSALYEARWAMEGSTVSVIDGELPPGLTLRWTRSISGVDTYDWSNIYLQGRPTKAGTYTFTVRAVNGMGGYTDSTQTVYIADKSSQPFADSSMYIDDTFKKGKLGVSYTDYVYVWGGTSPYKVSKISGTIPPGLSVVPIGRYIYLYGKPTNYDTYTFTLRVTGAHNGYTEKQFRVNITNNSSYGRANAATDGKPKFATTKIPDAAVYSNYNVPFEAGGTQPITWSYTGDIPDGFTFTDTGVLFGVPTEEGKYKFRVTATNSEGSASKSFTLKVLPQKPVIITESLPDGIVNEPYSFTLDSEGDSIKWSKSGKFPKGLKLDKNTGEIYGTPTKAGTYTFKVKAKNKAGKDTVEFTMTINDGSVSKTGTLTSSAIPENNAVVHESSTNITELYLLKDGQEFDEGASVEAGMPLTFRIGEVPDEDDSESAASISGVKVFVNGEELDGAEVAGDGKFSIPGGTVDGNFTVYASGFADGEEFETTEVEIQTAGASESSGVSTEASGGCSVGFAGMIMLMMSGIVLRKK